MATRRRPRKRVMATVRKPMAPPARVEEDATRYRREREREKLRRAEKSEER